MRRRLILVESCMTWLFAVPYLNSQEAYPATVDIMCIDIYDMIYCIYIYICMNVNPAFHVVIHQLLMHCKIPYSTVVSWGFLMIVANIFHIKTCLEGFSTRLIWLVPIHLAIHQNWPDGSRKQSTSPVQVGRNMEDIPELLLKYSAEDLQFWIFIINLFPWIFALHPYIRCWHLSPSFCAANQFFLWS